MLFKFFNFTFQSCVLSQDYLIYNKRGTERSIQRNKAFESQKVENRCKYIINRSQYWPYINRPNRVTQKHFPEFFSAQDSCDLEYFLSRIKLSV